MIIRNTILADESFPRSGNEIFLTVLSPLVGSDWLELAPSDWVDVLQAYERIWLIQACVEVVLEQVKIDISSNLEQDEFPSYPSVDIDAVVHAFLKNEWFEEWQQALPPEELQVVINETRRQVETQWIAWRFTVNEIKLYASIIKTPEFGRFF